LRRWATLPPGREKEHLDFEINTRFNWKDQAMASWARDLYLKTPETDPALRESLFGLWVAAPSQSAHVMEIASSTDDPEVLKSLGGILAFNEDYEGCPGGVALLGKRLQSFPRREMAQAILEALERSQSTESSRFRRDWASAHPEEPELRRQVIEHLDDGVAGNHEYLAGIVQNPQEDKDVQVLALKGLGKYVGQDPESLQQFLAIGFDPSLRDDLRLQAARTLSHAVAWGTDRPAPILTVAKRAMENVISADPFREVRDVARRAALEAWRKEWHAQAWEAERARPEKPFDAATAERNLEEFDRISAAITQRRRNGEISREQADAELERQTAHLRDPSEDFQEARRQREEAAYMDRLDALHPEMPSPDGKSWRDLDRDP